MERQSYIATVETEAKGVYRWKILTLNQTGEEQPWDISFSLNSVQHPESTVGNISKTRTELGLLVSRTRALRSLFELINWFE
jgi:hypothetical protein